MRPTKRIEMSGNFISKDETKKKTENADFVLTEF